MRAGWRFDWRGTSWLPLVVAAVTASIAVVVELSSEPGDQQIATRSGPGASAPLAPAVPSSDEPEAGSSLRSGLHRMASAAGQPASAPSPPGIPLLSGPPATAGPTSTTTAPPLEQPTSTSTAPAPDRPPVRLPPPPPVPDAGPDTDTATFYVSADTGDDGNDGQSADSPWRSLQVGLDRIGPGQTLYVMDGRYDQLRHPGTSHYTLSRGGESAAWIRIAAAPGHRPEIVASDGNGISVTGDYVEISGLTIRGVGFGIDNAYGWGIIVRNAHHVRLVGNRVSGMPVGGLSAVESTNLEFLDNIVHDNSYWGTEQGSGISVWHSVDHGTSPSADGYHDKIVGNVSFRNENRVFSRWAPGQDLITDGNGIIIDESRDTGYTGRTLVANNLVFDNGGRGIIVNRAARVDVVHNTSYHNGWTPGLAGGPVELAAVRSTDIRLLNNLAWSRPGAPAVIVDEVAGLTRGGNVLVTDRPPAPSGELDLVIDHDPGLVAPDIDLARADFRPRAGSVVIDRGIVFAPPLPFDANRRGRPAAAPDAGAYEYQAE